MRVRITFRRETGFRAAPHAVRAEPPLFVEPPRFSELFARQQSRWPSLLASVTAHGLALILIPTLVKALSGIDYVQTEWATFTPVPLRLELPEPLYFPAVRPRPRLKEQSNAQKSASVRQSQQAGAAATAGLQSRRPLPKQLELPVTRHISDRAPVILQPEMDVVPAPSIPAAPPLAFWTTAVQPPRRRAVIPGRVRRPSVSPNLDAPPVLSAPNPQPAASDVAAVLAGAQTPPKLTLPNASTNPVRIAGKGEPEIGSFDLPQSDPVNLIYLMANNVPTRQIEIPRGLQNTPRAAGEGGTAVTAGHAPDDRQKTGDGTAATHSTATSGTGRGMRPSETANAAGTAASAHAPGTGRAGASPVNSTGTAAGSSREDVVGAAKPPQQESPSQAVKSADRAAANAADRSAANTADLSAASPTARPAANAADRSAANAADRSAAPSKAPMPEPARNNSAEVIRTTHPSSGNFDVVILQSVTRDDLPDAGGALSGNPVYTVYLSVGDAREWLLEYCIPASVNSRASSFQVNIDDPGAISAPYPLSTVIPRNVFDLPHPKDIVLHGRLSAAGILHGVEGSNMDSALIREVLPLLSQWQFRPALRDQVPVEVEILLIIPRRS